MYSKNKSFFGSLLDLRISEDLPFIEAQKNQMFKLFLLIGMPFAFIFLIFNLFAGLYFEALFNLTQICVFSLGFYINYKQKHLNYRSLLLVVLTLNIMVTAFYLRNGAEYRFLIMIIVAIVLFDKSWQYLSFTILLSLGFVYLRLDNIQFYLSSANEAVREVIQVLLPLVFFILSLYFFKNSYVEYQAKLEKAYEDLRLAKEQKDRILNVVAHDLRSPISSITGISKLMLLDGNLSEEHAGYIRLIEHSSASSIALINDLLQTNLTLLDAYNFQQTDLRFLVHQSLLSLEFNANEKEISIVSELSDERLLVNIDVDKIDRVMTNLVNNAIKFSDAGTTITIRLYRDEKDAILEIKDNGIGIPADSISQVFDIFTDAKRKGTAGEQSFGLGLSICKQIIDIHHGSIYVESVEGKGSSFFVKIPVVQIV